MRNPAVSGQFYPDDKSQLSAEISNCFKSPLGPGSDVSKKPISERTIIGAVSPHAGYMFSGPVAAHLYYALRNQKAPSTVVIVGPNHTGYGAGLAVTTEDFLSPLGIAKTDTKLVEKLVDDLYVVDPSAHAYEHSIEVQIPFMQYIGWDAKIVPICVGVH
ncbi:MAG: AmmeMemoRadiSam system protein B, partial [Thermoplasmata archaeon]|nr:AmmeMemoRadiSam system protein B [Thermoplasmata archaeon]